jgi:hypothetical protein
MKKKFSIFNFKFFYYLRQILGNEYPDSKSEVAMNKVVIKDNLRLQDDGGPVVDVVHPIDSVFENDPAKPTYGPGDAKS